MTDLEQSVSFCLLCHDRPRAVRVQCGHLFACAECIRGITICAICRKPITASYNISGVDNLSNSSKDDYVSSGSNTFVNMELCHTDGCTQEATHWFTCIVCTSTGNATRFALCLICVERPSVSCPYCSSIAVEDVTHHGPATVSYTHLTLPTILLV